MKHAIFPKQLYILKGDFADRQIERADELI